jgi:bacillithiol biosynthesis deacetylase BshB1
MKARTRKPATKTPAALDVLALAAHRDDVEQTCGGTLLKMAERGAVTGILDLTAGEAGTRGSAAERTVEAELAAGILMARWRDNVGLPDGALELRDDYRRRIGAVIRATRPRILIIPYPKARHPDHYTAGMLGYEAAFIAGLKNLDLGEAEPFRPFTILYASLYADERPTFVVDITDQFDRRMLALTAYSSQYSDQSAGKDVFPAQADIPIRVEALARTFGMRIGVKYGEPFISPTPLRVDDLRELHVDTFTRGGLIAPF